jgi:hypothetical protein
MPFELGGNFQGKSSKRRSKAPVGLWLMLLQHPLRCVSDWCFMPEIQRQWSLINRFKKMCAKLMFFFAAENGMFQAHIWAVAGCYWPKESLPCDCDLIAASKCAASNNGCLLG